MSSTEGTEPADLPQTSQSAGPPPVSTLALATVFNASRGADSSAADGSAGSHQEQEKWARILHQGVHAFHTKHPDKFQRRLTRGIPAACRWQVWKNALYLEAKVHPGRYSELCGLTCTWAHLIDMDTPRTCFDTSKFDDAHRESLRRVLYAYSIHNPKGFYQEKFPLLHRYMNVFGQLMESQLPDLGEHFHQENLQSSDYLQQWFLTLFVNVLPLPTVLIVWDSIMCKGLPVLLHTTVVLLQSVKHVLLAKPFEDIMHFFREMKLGQAEADAVTIGQLLMKKGGEIKIPPGVLQQLVFDP